MLVADLAELRCMITVPLAGPICAILGRRRAGFVTHLFVLAAALCAIAPSVQAQRLDIETQAPAGFIVVVATALLGADDLVAVGFRAEFAEQAMVFRISNGSIQWCKLLRDTSLFFNGSRVNDVVVAANGDLLLAGEESRAGQFMSWVARLDANGSLVWSTSLNLGEDIVGFSVIVEANDGTIYAVGRTGMGIQRNESVARFNADGDLLWMRDLPYAGSQYATHARCVSDTLLVLGSTTIGAGVRDIALFRYAPDGTLLSFRTFGSSANESPTAFLADGSGGHVITYQYNTAQGGVLHLDASHQPAGQPLILASPWALNVGGGAVWDTSSEEVILMGQASDATDWFAMVIRVSLPSGNVVWDRSLPGIGSATSCIAFGGEGHFTFAASGFNTNGSYPVHAAKLNLLTGNDVGGVPCNPPVPLDPFTFTGSITVIDHTITNRILSPAVIHDIPVQDLPLMVSPCLNAPLPIELVRWEGSALQNGNRLTWTTGWERDNAQFIIEHSVDRMQWQDIGVVPGQGSNGSAVEYEWMHQEVAVGVHYYRLRQSDFNGTSSVSHAIAVTRFEASSSRLLAKSPVVPGQFILFSEEVMLMDMAGRCVASTSRTHAAPQQCGVYLVKGRDRTEKLLVE